MSDITHTPDDGGSTDQSEWMDISRAVRAHLRKHAELRSAMSVADLKTFVDTIREAWFLEYNAATHDAQISRELAKLPFTE